NAVYYNNEKVTLDNLRNRLKNMPSLSKTVILKADKSVELGMVVQVIDVVKQTNIKDLVIATTQEE
ncbi:MAG TPA: biopolymer transporter ExbD, partial [Spirochaetota bacterium]|nr:biopolymer transporter ExbD [Spirochaetota bacterium]